MSKHLLFVVIGASFACAGAPEPAPPAQPAQPAIAAPTQTVSAPAAPGKAGKRGKHEAPAAAPAAGGDLTVALGTWYELSRSGDARVIANPDCGDNHPRSWTVKKTTSGFSIEENDGWGVMVYEVQQVTPGSGFLELTAEGHKYTLDTVGGVVNTIIDDRGGNYDVGQAPRFALSPERC